MLVHLLGQEIVHKEPEAAEVAVDHLIIQEEMELLALEAAVLVDVDLARLVEMETLIKVAAVAEEAQIILQQVEMVVQALL